MMTFIVWSGSVRLQCNTQPNAGDDVTTSERHVAMFETKMFETKQTETDQTKTAEQPNKPSTPNQTYLLGVVRSALNKRPN